MTREEINEVIKVMSAYVNGNKIQYLNDDGRWVDTPNPLFDWSRWEYRIKPQPNYRPFKNAEECWQEMLKHQPFGWVRSKDFTITCYTDVFTSDEVRIFDTYMHFPDAFKQYEFLDGTPFGIKEE